MASRTDTKSRAVWRGLFSNANRHSLPAGACQEQVNLTCIIPGELTGRKGMTRQSTAVAGEDILGLTAYRPAVADFLVYQNSAGKIKYFNNGTTGTLASSLSSYNRWSYTQASNGVLYLCNGIDAPRRWNGLTAALELWGIVPPSDQFAVAASATAGALTGTVYCGYRFVTADESPQYSALTQLRSVALTADMTNWGGAPGASSATNNMRGSTNARVAFVELFRSTTGESTTVYKRTKAGASGSVTSSASSGGGSPVHILTVPAGHHLFAGCKIAITGASGAGAAELNSVTHLVNSVTDTTITTETVYSAGVTTGGTWVFAGWDKATGISNTGDNATDAELNTSQSGIVTACTNSSTNVQIDVEASHGLEVGDLITLTNHPTSGYNNRTVLVRSVATNTLVLDMTHTAAGSAPFGNWTRDNTALPILDEFDEIYARKQQVPQDSKSVCVAFQDRIFMGVDVFYGTKTDSSLTVTTAGTTSITGVGTAFTSQMVGRFLYLDSASETVPYRIVAVGSATALTVDRATATSTSLSFTIRPDPSLEDNWYYSHPDEPESMPLTLVVKPQRRTTEMDRWTGALPYKDTLFLFKERSTYTLGFTKQAKIDAGIFLNRSRGAANHKCCAFVEDVGYVMDEFGPWRIGASGPDFFDDRIHDFWRDGNFNGSSKQWWWVEGDAANGVVRFWITTAAGRPDTCFVYSYRTDTWWKESYPISQFGGGAFLPASGVFRRYLGGEDDRVFLADQGLLDGTAGTGSLVRGTIAAGSTTTSLLLSNTSASDCNGGVIAIYKGTGERQIKRITSGQGTTTLVVEAFSTAPVEGDLYQIGAIEWNVKLGSFELVKTDNETMRALTVTYQPTSDATSNGDSYMDLRIYENHQSTASEMQQNYNPGTGVEYKQGNANVKVNMAIFRYANSQNPGEDIFEFPGRIEPRIQGLRYITPELRGYQGQRQTIIYGLDFDGAA